MLTVRKMICVLCAFVGVLMLFGCSNEEPPETEVTTEPTALQTLPAGIHRDGTEVLINIDKEVWYLLRMNTFLELTGDPEPVTVDAVIGGDLAAKDIGGFIRLECQSVKIPEMTEFSSSVDGRTYSIFASYFYRDEESVIRPGTIRYMIENAQYHGEDTVMIRITGAFDDVPNVFVVKAKDAESAHETFYTMFMDRNNPKT